MGGCKPKRLTAGSLSQRALEYADIINRAPASERKLVAAEVYRRAASESLHLANVAYALSSVVTEQFFTVENYVDQSTKLNAGGNIIGSASGPGASIIARDITVFRADVTTSTTLPDAVKKPLIEVREDIERHEDKEVKEVATSNLEQLTKQISSDKPNPSLVKTFLGGIKGAIGATSSFVSLCKNLQDVLGVDLVDLI